MQINTIDKTPFGAFKIFKNSHNSREVYTIAKNLNINSPRLETISIVDYAKTTNAKLAKVIKNNPVLSELAEEGDVFLNVNVNKEQKMGKFIAEFDDPWTGCNDKMSIFLPTLNLNNFAEGLMHEFQKWKDLGLWNYNLLKNYKLKPKEDLDKLNVQISSSSNLLEYDQ